MNTNIKYIKRDLEIVLREHLGKEKIIVIYGARQVGKTTLIRNLFPDQEVLYLACDQYRVREQISPDALVLKKINGDYKNIIFDEAQYLSDPGLILKVLRDNFPDRNIIASGSSSFDLAHKLSEPLTGRHYKFNLSPLSLAEISRVVSPLDMKFNLQEALIFGTYPEVFKLPTANEKIEHLRMLSDAYLYKDILQFHLIKNSQKVRELLIALALQIGNEVSYSELANTVGVDRKTVESYIDLLEKTFVVFRLFGFSRNFRSVINRKVEIYFCDNGIRNMLINHFNDFTKRSDTGALFENFVVSALVKRGINKEQQSTYYFWRTYD